MIPESLEEEFWIAASDRDFSEIDRLLHEHPVLKSLVGDFFLNAAAHGDVELATFLLDREADLNYANENGETAFSFACTYNQLEMGKFLVARGIEINTIDEGGGSSLDWAVCHASQEFRDWLISIGGKRIDDSSKPWPPPEADNDLQ